MALSVLLLVHNIQTGLKHQILIIPGFFLTSVLSLNQAGVVVPQPNPPELCLHHSQTSHLHSWIPDFPTSLPVLSLPWSHPGDPSLPLLLRSLNLYRFPVVSVLLGNLSVSVPQIQEEQPGQGAVTPSLLEELPGHSVRNSATRAIPENLLVPNAAAGSSREVLLQNPGGFVCAEEGRG